MSPQVVARRYAQALFDLALRREELEQVAAEMEHLLTLYRGSALLRSVLESPIHRSQQKLEWFRPVLSVHLSPMVWLFITLLVRRGREYLLNETCQAFLEVYDQHKKRLRARVRSAQPLTDKSRNTLVQRLQQGFGVEEVILEEKVEPALIGGLVLEVGMQAADLSVRTRLQEIHRKLLQES
ncbi:MAG: ATP synthase F1 subunit delta [Bacteroidia bacterium]|nr:ATP synthase F1 subunit delta [Bacteroidia bacterium]MDW8236598.1 ATP synthase F1 subunit delta [Bacteroidia bacterium]